MLICPGFATYSMAPGLTDAPGDFASYTVHVTSLTLTRADGTKVSTLPAQARIDFAQYTEMTEFFTSVSVPCGVFARALCGR